MGKFNYNRSIEIIKELISKLYDLKNNETRFNRFYMECLWLNQNINSGKIALPLKTIHTLFLAYIITEEVFSDYPTIQQLADELAETIQDVNFKK